VEPRTDLFPTASQTVGPYFGMALPWPDGPHVVGADHKGAVWIRGVVTDGNGDPIPDAMVETWQADADGTFPDDPEAGFRGFGRCPTDDGGAYGIRTIKPAAVAGPNGSPGAPYILVAVFMRGLLRPVITRLYFPDEPANDHDLVLAAIPEPARSTMVASQSSDGYRFDVRLQGEGQTAFFDL
jgi:protocatechuate 3,4-dioxygenase alpha subunit